MIDQAQTLKDLQTLKKLFSNETKWGKNKWYDEKNDCYCLGGGIMKIIQTSEFKAYNMLEPRAQHIREALGFFTTGALIHWNDSGLTTYRTVMDRLDTAIKKLAPPKTKPVRKSRKKIK